LFLKKFSRSLWPRWRFCDQKQKKIEGKRYLPWSAKFVQVGSRQAKINPHKEVKEIGLFAQRGGAYMEIGLWICFSHKEVMEIDLDRVWNKSVDAFLLVDLIFILFPFPSIFIIQNANTKTRHSSWAHSTKS
jgi:hypothetical protein